jgi:uncharacterized small protein (DUF1192 family)
MAKEPEDDPFGAPARPPADQHQIGQGLDSLSVAELTERIAALLAEIERLERARKAKAASLAAADSFFKI